MIRVFIIIIALSVSFSAFAQKKKKDKADAAGKTEQSKAKEITPDSLYLSVFRTGMKYGDYQVAVGALYNMMALHPENASLKDSLVLLYNGMGNSVQAVIIAREILLKDPNNLPILGAMAESEQRLGLYKEALGSYELLYDKRQQLYDLYQVAALQYAMKRYAEARNTLATIIRNPKAVQDKLQITGANNTSQNVQFKAAAYNLMGVVSLELLDYAEAQSNFKKALEIEPNFELANSNLTVLENELNKQKDSKTNTKTPGKK
ncbi:MAG: tetratricopeptide repeat protein [Bacteroidia bacterium]